MMQQEQVLQNLVEDAGGNNLGDLLPQLQFHH
jgi:hypothetical protein